jgi:hypothetical protein
MLMSKKSVNKKGFPRRADGVTDLLSRVEPVMTPELFRKRFMLGLPKVLSNGDEITDDILKDKIVRATNRAEIELGVHIDPVEMTDRLPFDRNLFRSFVHLRTTKRPIQSVKQVAIFSSNQEALFELPTDWVDMGQAINGQLNVIPFLAAYSRGAGTVTTATNSGIAFLATLEAQKWLASYWNITYTTGLCNKAGEIPVIVNDLIGTLAAIEILSLLGPTDPYTSASLGQDGISQSHSSAGIQRFQNRLGELVAERDRLISKLKGLWKTKIFVSNI